jgi:hypothetical protein
LTSSTPARDLIAKQKQRQAKQERALQDEQHDLCDIKHVEIPHARTGFSSNIVMAQAEMAGLSTGNGATPGTSGVATFAQ